MSTHQLPIRAAAGVTLGDETAFAGFAQSGVKSSATSALGELLTKATLLGAGRHGGVASHTSAYFSVEIGLIHVAAIDLNGGSLGQAQTGPGPAGPGLSQGQPGWRQTWPV